MSTGFPFKLVAWGIALTLVALPILGVLNGWFAGDRWPVTRLDVSARFDHVSAEQIRAAAQPLLGKGFFALDLDDVRAAVAKLPWVERAEVRKRWPDVLEVTVYEHRPFARWSGGLLLSEQGRLFPANGIDVPKGLPQLGGPEARVSEVVELYNESRAMFAPIGLEVRVVELDPRGSWTLGLDNGARIVVGRSEARARLSRFVRLLPQLLTQQAQVLKLADLRYTNGFALTWAPVPAPAAVLQQQGQS